MVSAYGGVTYPDVRPLQKESRPVDLAQEHVLQYRMTQQRIAEGLPSIRSVLSRGEDCSNLKRTFSSKLNKQLDEYFGKKAKLPTSKPEFLDESIKDIKRKAEALTKLPLQFPLPPPSSIGSEGKLERSNSSLSSLEKNSRQKAKIIDSFARLV